MTDDPDPQFPDPEFMARLEAAVQSLPRQRREVFLAVRVHAMSYADTAQATGLSVRQVERHVARARLQIDDHLQRQGTPPRRPWWRRLWSR